jgi:hypothetical protein
MSESVTSFSKEKDVCMLTTQDPQFDNICSHVFTFSGFSNPFQPNASVNGERSIHNPLTSVPLKEEIGTPVSSSCSPVNNSYLPVVIFATFHPNLTHLIILTRKGTVHAFHPDTHHRIDYIFFMPQIHNNKGSLSPIVCFIYYLLFNFIV